MREADKLQRDEALELEKATAPSFLIKASATG